LTLEKLERSLPNGLHDAELVGLHVDYATRRVVFELNVDISQNAVDEGTYRRAQVTFAGLQFVAVDPPNGNEHEVGVSTIDAGTGQPVTAPCPLPEIRKDCFLCWLFVVRWNSFIRIAAQTVNLEWIDSK
jgi:hypothetical protein